MTLYQVRSGPEVEMIIETDDGRVAALEIKSSATVGGNDVRWLAGLRDRLGKRFVGVLVLRTGRTAAPFGDRLAAVPLDVLWPA